MKRHWKDLSLQEKKAYMSRLTLMDDLFMTAVLGSDKACTQTVIRIIMESDDLIVEQVTPQAVLTNLSGHTVRLDILAIDTHGTRFDIEIQRLSKGASSRRARYYSSMLDAAQTIQNQDYDTLHDTRVIFLTEEDVIGLDRQCYRIKRMIVGEENVVFEDGEQIIYVNCAKQSNGRIGKLAHDFQCPNPDQMYYDSISATVRRFKLLYEEEPMNTIEKESSLSRQEIASFWENHWCEHFRDAYHEGREEGREEGLTTLLLQLMKKDHRSAESVVADFSFSPEERDRLIAVLNQLASDESEPQS